jgi:O-antigen ligase
VVGLYLLCAGLLGGGGLYFPAQELFLELLFAGVILFCLWSRRAAGVAAPDARLVYFIAGLVLVIPVLQLVPLPPDVWQSLPGREDALAALRLVDEGDSWRPISLVPDRTLACLLALIPPVGLLILTSQLDLKERRQIIYASVVLAVLTTAMGAAQLLAPGGSLTFYTPYYSGWITGFQAGRNGTADVLLIGLIAVGALTRLALIGKIGESRSGQSAVPALTLGASLAALLSAAVVMTGSRAGVTHLALAILAWIVMFSIEPKGTVRLGRPSIAVAGLCGVILAGVTFLTFAGGSALGRIGQRFAVLENNRADVWELAIRAWHAHWPVGIGRGGYIDAVLPLEPLESVGINWPNRAHGEYIEMGIEAGLAAYVALAAGLISIAALSVRAWRAETSREARIQLVFAAAVLVLLGIHSSFDYPLRSLSLACFAGAICGLLTAAPRREPQ